jgi:glyoxylase-like metal-dependent hydrolase (beta-lactamase superfamily II)
MRQLTEQLWWVNDVAPSAGIYLWREGDELMLFDCGMPWQAGAILSALARNGFAPAQLRHIVITHSDFDHIGSARVLKQATGASLVCHAVTAAILRGQMKRAWGMGVVGRSLDVVLRAVTEPFFHSLPLEADLMLVDGDPVPGGFKAVYTPGHCAGHTAYYHPKASVLIIGDAFTHAGGRLALTPAIFTADHATTIENVGRLAHLEAKIVCPGHQEPILEDAPARLRAFAEEVKCGA